MPSLKTFNPEAGRQIRDAYNESSLVGQVATARVVYGTAYMLPTEESPMGPDMRFSMLSDEAQTEVIFAAAGVTAQERGEDLFRHPRSIEKRLKSARDSFDSLSLLRLMRHLHETRQLVGYAPTRLRFHTGGGYASMMEGLPKLGAASYDLNTRGMHSADIDELLFFGEPNAAVRARVQLRRYLAANFRDVRTRAHAVSMLYGASVWEPIEFSEQLARIGDGAPEQLLWQ